MTEQNRPGGNQPNEWANKGRGPQGVDKAPGEEEATGTDNPVYETQKGKNKVDGDPSQPSDQPMDES
jgi:hypothetical protein